jgi:hypothetical protein
MELNKGIYFFVSQQWRYKNRVNQTNIVKATRCVLVKYHNRFKASGMIGEGVVRVGYVKIGIVE